MVQTHLQLAREYEQCEQEDLITTHKVQAGFRVLAVADGCPVAATNITPEKQAVILQQLAATPVSIPVNARYQIVKTADHGRWLRHTHNGVTFYEQPTHEPQENHTPLPHWQGVIEQAHGNLWKLGFVICELVQSILMADRVMIYRFHEDWSGEVIAEKARPSLDPYLGLRYPATDIPKVARDLYQKTGTRHIFTTLRTDETLTDVAEDMPPLDMTYAISRKVSPYHLEYLRNMGSGSTASCALMYEGKLWGLLSLHWTDDRFPDLDEFVFLQNFSATFQTLLEKTLNDDKDHHTARVTRLLDRFSETLNDESEPFSAMMLSQSSIAHMIGSQGATLLMNQYCTQVGRVPDKAVMLALCDTAGQDIPVFETVFLETLPDSIPQEGRRGIAGCSITRLGDDPDAFLLTYRVGVSQTVTWGGDPRRHTQLNDRGRVSPRKSFTKWVETVEGRCAPWSALSKDIIATCLSQITEMFDLSPHELVILLQNGMRQAVRRREKIRVNALDFVDGIRTAIAVVVEQDGEGSGQILAVNPAAADAFSISVSEARDMSLIELENYAGVALQNGAHEKFIGRIITANKGIRACEVSVNLLFEYFSLDTMDKPFKIVVHELRDITETQRVEQALAAARERAETDGRMRAEFFAKLSHELKTPLNALIGFSSLLLEGHANKMDGKMRALAESIFKASDHMVEVITQSLDSAVAINAFSEDSVMACDVAAIAQEAMVFMETLAASHGVNVSLAMTEGSSVKGNPRALKQVLLNLASNAIKYNVPGGQVNLYVKPLSDDFAEICVHDTGCGMTEEQIQQCIQPYKRFSNKDGAGLGLSITNHLVRLMGGMLTIQSAVGQGTTVCIKLPVATPDMAEMADHAIG